MKKILHIFLSLILVYATTANSYAAGSSWNVTSSIASGGRAVVTATKAGYKSAVNIAPTAGRLGLKLAKGANQAAIAYAVVKLLGNGVDWVLDPANNGIKHTQNTSGTGPFTYKYILDGGRGTFDTLAGAAARMKQDDPNYYLTEVSNKNSPKLTSLNLYYSKGGGYYGTIGIRAFDYSEKVTPMSSVSKEVVKNAIGGHAASNQAIADTAREMVATGDFDANLIGGAVPTNDSRPLVPSVPITGNGNVTVGGFDSTAGGGTGVDGGMTGADLGVAADAAKNAADAAKKAAQAAADAAKASADDARRAADDAVDVVNSAVDQALKDIAEKAADDAKKAADDAKSVENRAKELADEAAKEALKTAEKVREAADKREKELRDTYDKALEEDKALALEKVKDAEKALDEAKEKVKEAEKAAEKAKAEVPKPIEFPAFCTWAKPVCDAIDWIKKDPVAVAPELVPVDAAPSASDATDFDVNYVNFGGQCPVLPSFNIGVGLNVTPMTFDMTPLCEIAVAIRPAIIAMAYFIGLGIVASSIRGT